MSPSPSQPPADWIELVAGDALGDLDDSERDRLASLAADTTSEEAESLCWTAAALQLAFAGSPTGPNGDPMPPSLRAAILRDAPAHLASASDPVTLTRSIETESPMNRREALAWLAAAASLTIAVGTWFASGLSQTPVASNLAQDRAKLLSSEDPIEVAWADGTTPFAGPVSGDVVWSTPRQTGFMRFVGMPVNDPTIEQYQLWIIDPQRDDEPIDGGVFDITQAGEVIVPIHAKLSVIDPAAFAITIEKPGGVVVSTQERLPLLASVSR